MTADEIIENYDYYNEDNRLKDAYGMMEEAHTRRLILKNIDSASSIIFDIGAGTGPYSIWLAELGHKVHYSDIVPKHVDLFRSRHGMAGNILSIGVEDARHLGYKDNSADVIILNGPLYHLPGKDDRIQVLKEAKRVLKPNGRLLGFTISRFAGLHYALSSGEVFNDHYFNMVLHEIETGTRDNRDLKNKTFIRAYFHTLEEIEAEFSEAGLNIAYSAGVVGPAWNTPGLADAIKEDAKKERLLSIAALMEKYPMQSPKIMTVGIK
jgi:ubiquinone/menaquinone biosynthesis C-methylase UbiE